MRALLALSALALATQADAGPVDEFLAFSAGAKSATARFEQQVFDRAGKLVDRSSGTLAFSRPGLFRWSYEKPVRQLLVADGTRLWIHDPDLNQVTVKRIDRAVSSTPAALLAGRDDIVAHFTLKDAGTSEGLGWVEAIPRTKDTGFESVRLGLKGRMLAAMELADSLGGRTHLSFSRFELNPALDAGTFRFVPPKGADVLDDAK